MLTAILILFAWLLLLKLSCNHIFSIGLLGFVGVLMHELMHLVVGLLLFAKPININLLPKRGAQGWILGSVSFTNLTIFNAVFVSLAPLLLLPIAVFIFYKGMLPLVETQQYGWLVLAGYGAATLLFNAWPSSTDFKQGAASFIFWLVCCFVLLALNYWQGWISCQFVCRY